MIKLFTLSLLISTSIFFTACNQNTIVIPKEQASTNVINLTLNDAILSLANQLSQNNKMDTKDTGTITLTSFVDLKKLNATSQFGRILGESLFSELFIRGFNITDFRGQNAISVNKTGEFFITRNVEKLDSEVSNTYVLVGTYSKIDQNVMINARILDNKTGKLITSARAMYANDDCSIFGICNNIQRKIKIVPTTYTKLMVKNSINYPSSNLSHK
jgi:TolB-like protein